MCVCVVCVLTVRILSFLKSSLMNFNPRANTCICRTRTPPRSSRVGRLLHPCRQLCPMLRCHSRCDRKSPWTACSCSPELCEIATQPKEKIKSYWENQEKRKFFLKKSCKQRWQKIDNFSTGPLRKASVPLKRDSIYRSAKNWRKQSKITTLSCYPPRILLKAFKKKSGNTFFLVRLCLSNRQSIVAEKVPDLGSSVS